MPRNNGYNYNAAELKEILQRDPSFQLNKNQILILFPNLTSNFIKHYTSPRCKDEDRMPCGRKRNGKPYFIYNQVDAYIHKFNQPLIQENSVHSEEPEGNKGKIRQTG